MADSDLISKGLDQQIITTQQRFQRAMEARLPDMPLETKERYFAVLSLMVAKLENSPQALRDVLQDVMIEAAPYIAQELSGH